MESVGRGAIKDSSHTCATNAPLGVSGPPRVQHLRYDALRHVLSHKAKITRGIIPAAHAGIPRVIVLSICSTRGLLASLLHILTRMSKPFMSIAHCKLDTLQECGNGTQGDCGGPAAGRSHVVAPGITRRVRGATGTTPRMPDHLATPITRLVRESVSPAGNLATPNTS